MTLPLPFLFVLAWVLFTSLAWFREPVKWFFIRLWYYRLTNQQTVRIFFDHDLFQPGDHAHLAGRGELRYLGNNRWLVL